MSCSVRWFPPSWVMIQEGDRILYVDPAYLKRYFMHHPTKVEFAAWPKEIDGLPERLPPANAILLTHHHKDHCKAVTVKRLTRPDTEVYGPGRCAREIGNRLRIIEPGARFTAAGFEIEAVHAYNTAWGSASRGTHRRGAGVGYLVRTGGRTLYHAGDTSFIPEMESLGRVAVAFVPIDGVFTMDMAEAVRACEAIRPGVAVPIHDMGKADPLAFKEELLRKAGIRAEVMGIGEVLRL